MHYGARVRGRLEQKSIPDEKSLTGVLAPQEDLTTAGGIYQIDLHTNGITNPEAAIAQILSLEATEPDLKFLYIEADPKSNIIQIQFMDTGPGQFSFTGLLAAMPMILGVVFIIVIGYVLYTVYASNPFVLWLLVALGAGVAFFYFTSDKIRPSSTPIITRGSGGLRESATKTEQRETNLRKALDEYDSQINRAERNIDAYEKEIDKAKDEGSRAKFEKLIDDSQQRIEKAEKKRDEILERLSRL